MRFSTRVSITLVTLLGPWGPLAAQVIDLTVHNVGLAIGDKPEMTGLRINFRDGNLREVNGVNLTLWSPYEPPTGTVNGLALGVPATGARAINGIAGGVLGVGAQQNITGLGVGGIGLGAGGELRGIMLGGIGVGSGQGITGLSIGGIGVGSGGPIRGIQVGIIGVGSASDVTGISIGGVGVGAPTVKGLAASVIAAGGKDVHAIVIAGAYFKVEERGRFDGGSLSAFNNVRGEQRGLTIGLLNYARELHGAQVGLINISDNGGSRRVLPLISVR